MKRTLMLAALCVAALAGSALMAQANNEINVSLQHPTQIGDKQLPAGDYSIRVLVSSGGTPLVAFQSKQATIVALANRWAATPSQAGKTQLVLDEHEGVYKLVRLIAGSEVFEFVQ